MKNIKQICALLALILLLGGCIHGGMPSFHLGGGHNGLPKHGDRLYVKLCAECHSVGGDAALASALSDGNLAVVVMRGSHDKDHDHKLTGQQVHRLIAYVQALTKEKE